MKTKKSLLFLCVANSVRSQMAEGLARHYFGKQFVVQSAGSMASRVHPHVIQVMKELGINISNQYSKSVNEIDPKSVDAVITLCAEEVCPVFLGKAHHLHWPMADPSSMMESNKDSLAAFRKIRDAILQKLKNFAQTKEPPC